MKIILFHLDNTIADMDHRMWHLQQHSIDWDSFEADSYLDSPIQSTIKIMEGFRELGHQVWIWTGRSDGVKSMTLLWLERYDVPYDQLLMRPHADEIGTLELKKRWLNDAPVPKSKVLCAFDDDPKIITMLRKEGLTTYHIE